MNIDVLAKALLQEELCERIIQKAWNDPEFLHALHSKPEKVFARESGLKLPLGVKLTFLVDTDDTLNLVLTDPANLPVTERGTVKEALLQKAWVDCTFRQALLDNPKQVYADFTENKFSDIHNIHVVEQTPGHLYGVISRNPDDMTLEALNQVTGGTAVNTAKPKDPFSTNCVASDTASAMTTSTADPATGSHELPSAQGEAPIAAQGENNLEHSQAVTPSHDVDHSQTTTDNQDTDFAHHFSIKDAKNILKHGEFSQSNNREDADYTAQVFDGAADKLSTWYGFDIDSHSDVLKAVLCSNAYSHGSYYGAQVFNDAAELAGQELNSMTDVDIISYIYEVKLTDMFWTSGSPELRSQLFPQWRSERADALEALNVKLDEYGGILP